MSRSAATVGGTHATPLAQRLPTVLAGTMPHFISEALWTVGGYPSGADSMGAIAGLWHIASYGCIAPIRQQSRGNRTCHGHGWIDAIDLKPTFN